MKKNNVFDILNNADEETVDWLSDCSAPLSDSDLKRMFAKSEKKYAHQKKYFFSVDSDTTDKSKVIGVERYSRTRFCKAAFAASVCLLTTGAAVTGIILLNKLGRKNTVSPIGPSEYDVFSATTSYNDNSSSTTYKEVPVRTSTALTTASSIYTTSTQSVYSNELNEPSEVEIPIPESTTAATSDISSSEEREPPVKNTECSKYADKLLIALNYIDKIGGGNVTFDMDTAFTDENGNTFAKVIDTQFSNTDDLRTYIESHLTEAMINRRYSGILYVDEPRYIDVNGELYGKVAPTGSGFNFLDKNREISDITDASFTVYAPFEWYGSTQLMVIHVVLDNGEWKIDSFESI